MHRLRLCSVLHVVFLVWSLGNICHAQQKPLAEITEADIRQRVDDYAKTDPLPREASTLSPLLDLSRASLTYDRGNGQLRWTLPAKRELKDEERKSVIQQAELFLGNVLGNFRGGLVTQADFQKVTMVVEVQAPPPPTKSIPAPQPTAKPVQPPVRQPTSASLPVPSDTAWISPGDGGCSSVINACGFVKRFDWLSRLRSWGLGMHRHYIGESCCSPSLCSIQAFGRACSYTFVPFRGLSPEGIALAAIYVDPAVAVAKTRSRENRPGTIVFASLERATPSSSTARALAMSHYSRGFSHFWRQDYRGAQTEFDASVSLYPEDARFWYFKGLTECALGDVQSQESLGVAVRLELLGKPGKNVLHQSLERIQGSLRTALVQARQNALMHVRELPARAPQLNRVAAVPGESK